MGVNQTLLQKVAENWSGFNYSNVGPGGLIRTRPLPQSNGMGGSKTWGAAGAAPAAQPAADLPIKAIPPAMKAIPQKASPAALGAGAAGMAAPKAQAAGAGAAQPQSRVNPYDDPNYDHYSNPGLDVIKHLRNATRPVRKELHPAIMRPTKQGADTMSINPELLQKAAKVYEAAESVEGMKPKEVYESHKKCAPGEFNMNKEGYAKLQHAIAKVARQKQAADPRMMSMAEGGTAPQAQPKMGDIFRAHPAVMQGAAAYAKKPAAPVTAKPQMNNMLQAHPTALNKITAPPQTPANQPAAKQPGFLQRLFQNADAF